MTLSELLGPKKSDQAERKLERELLRRRAKDELIAFTEYTYPKYKTALVHYKIAEQLDRVRRGEIDRLGLLVPPRHGKSELASRRFPAQYLGHHPDRFFISASASSPLAADFGRDVRNVILSPEYGEIFKHGTRISEDSQAKNSWHTSGGGQYYAVGIGTAIMGRGAHIFLIDDPFGSMTDARSPTERARLWEWYSGTAYNRLEDKAAIVLINHRMHEDDLTGMIRHQEQAGGDKFEWVELKAIDKDESGNETALWPEKFPLRTLRRIQANIKAVDWSALYQQNPTPDSGIYFSASWLRPYTKAPDRSTLRIYGASDYAVTDNGGDYTVHIVVGVDPEGKLWLLDLWRGQTNSLEWVESFCELVKEWKPLGWARETGQIKGGVGPFLSKRQREVKAFVAFADFPTKGDKVIRSASIRGRMELDGLYVPVGAPWYPDFRQELLAFNAGKHDDQVDALGLIGQILDRMVAGDAPEAEKAHKIISTDPAVNNVTLQDLFEVNSARKIVGGKGRIR